MPMMNALVVRAAVRHPVRPRVIAPESAVDNDATGSAHVVVPFHLPRVRAAIEASAATASTLACTYRLRLSKQTIKVGKSKIDRGLASIIHCPMHFLILTSEDCTPHAHIII